MNNPIKTIDNSPAIQFQKSLMDAMTVYERMMRSQTIKRALHNKKLLRSAPCHAN